MLKFAPGMGAYADLRTQVFGRLSSSEKGDPAATAEAVLKIVDAPELPLRFIVGSAGLPAARSLRCSHGHLGGVGGCLKRSARRATENYGCPF
jgi:hypothetical protein